MKRTTFVIIASFMVLAVVYPVYGQADEQIRVSGASTMFPFVAEILELHKEIHGVEFEIAAGGSGTGINNTISGASDIGMASRSISDSEKLQVEDLLVGLDTIVFVVNERNPINEISQAQLKEMYSQENVTWERFGWTNTPIVLVSKEIGRATLDLFEDFAGIKSPYREQQETPKILESAIEVGANLEVATIVGGIPNAIGYLSLGTAVELQERGMPIKILRLEGVEATTDNIVNGSYPILRELNVVYRADNEAKVQSLLELLLSDQGQEIIEKHSFIPVN
ncbi:phosphate ABC transporter substrate-binding protein [Desulfuribacillus alkaliarsenatis]|uniref:PBP domain-containing protein n=1 Tax=Desulfuribacillus alkaliarsenatis TaxID=766136 RepID=A0A1E5G4F4_9FIRM|nr:phosphate ABC transporter substrate-binding protein [Desulfuribacillus alkaliarsenatis]OEF97975.1 hypothetical protein BHF68_12970 [Desulfuribacillus alkaliarsenatis]